MIRSQAKWMTFHALSIDVRPGVPNITATSWNIEDKEAVGVAVQFYMGLINETEELEVSRSARSLHATLLDIRNRGLSPYVWATYAHFGA